MAQYTFDTLFDFIVLPSGYTKQLSLISDGNQYILLPSTNGNPSGVRILFKVLTPYCGDNSIYGQINNYEPIIAQVGNLTYLTYKSGTGGLVSFATDSNKHIADINYNGDKKIIIDGNLLFTATEYYTNNKPLAIFNAYFDNGVYYGQPCEIFYAEPTINDTNGNVLSKMTLIPASNGIDLGLYDIENDIFYTNNGTGTFTSGGTAPTYNFQNGDTCTITELNLTMTYNDGYFWIADNQSLTFSQATQLFSFAKGNNGVTATITDLGITLTSDGTDWYVTSDITIPTVSQATQLFSFAKGDNGVTVTVTSTGGVYKYDGDEWQLWYTIIPPLVFRGFSFEQTDYWQKPEMVFRGFSFEITDKVGGASMFHGMS